MTPNTRYININSALSTTTTFKSGAGFLNKITINTWVASGTLTVYDSLTATGTKIASIALPATGGVPITLTYEANFQTGLTILSTVAGLDFTVSLL